MSLKPAKFVCAQCGEEIGPGETYLKVCDNFIQRRFFDDPDERDNVFCSQACVCDALSVMEFEVPDSDVDETFKEEP